jgi:hypothetical protein
MAEVGSAFVSVVPSAKGFGSKLDSEVGGELDSSGKKAGSRFGSMMKVGAAAAIGGAIVAGKFLVDSIGEAREAQKVSALTASTIKATGNAAGVSAKQVADLAGAISLKTGIDDETIQSGQNMLLTFKNIRNEAGKGNDIFNQSTKTLVDMSAAMGSEPKQAAIQLGKALNDPVKGISALSRVGVTFTEKQKKVIEGLVKGGETAKAQKIILGELNSEFGGAAEAQATAGEKASVAFGNLKEAVGTALLPALDRVLNLFTEFAIFLTTRGGPALFKVQSFFKNLAGSGGAGALMSTLTGLGASIKANFLPVLQTMANTFQTVILPAILRLIGYLRANLVPIFVTVAGIIANQVVPIVATFAKFLYGTLYPAVIRIVTAVASRLKPVFDQLFKTIRSTVLPAIQQLLAKFREIQPTLQKVVGIVVTVIGWVLKLAASILGKVLPVVIRFAGFLIKTLVRAIIGVITAIQKVNDWVDAMAAAFVSAIGSVGRFAGGVADKIGAAVGFIRDLPGKAKDALGNLGSLLLNAGEELIQGLINGITNKLSALGDKMKEVADKVKGFLPGSPVKEGPLRSWNNGGAGKRLVGLLADGLNDTRPISAAMDRLSAGIAVRGPGALAVAAGGTGGGRSTLHVYDRDNVLIGTMEAVADGRVHARRRHDKRMATSG